MTDFDAIDFFRDTAFVADPYPYFEFLREECPVRRERHHDVMMVTGYEEAIAVFHDTATFSSCNSVTGPFPGFPVSLVGDDVSALIERHRVRGACQSRMSALDHSHRSCVSVRQPGEYRDARIGHSVRH